MPPDACIFRPVVVIELSKLVKSAIFLMLDSADQMTASASAHACCSQTTNLMKDICARTAADPFGHPDPA